MADNSFSDGAPSDSLEAAKDASATEKLTDQVMQNPQVLAALQERLDSVSHTPSSYIETLPKAVKRRINALKQLQVKCAHIEAKFYEEVHDLERKYAALYQPLFDKRREFVTGDVEPTDAESEWHSENEEEDKLAGDMKSKVVIAEKEAEAAEEPAPRGIPEFWFTIFRNVDMLSELVQEYDEPILKHLQDIKVKFSDPGQPMSFVLEFHFEPNDYFTNSVLTKTYKMKSEPDKADPFSFEGPEIVDCDGCTIDWKKGKNVTVKTIKKKQKHKGRGTVRTITKQVPNDSFFNFFSPLKASGDGESLDEDSEFTLASDFEIGHFFRERIVPRAVLYFTGEAIEDDDNFEEGEEGEEEELEGDEEGEEEDDADASLKKGLTPAVPVHTNKEDTDTQTNLGFIHAFVAAISVIIVSELGDKTFFIAAIMAMRYNRLTVLAGAMLALGLMTCLSVLFGYATTVIPRVYTYYVSTALFAIFGIRMLREGLKMSPDEGQEELEEVQAELKKKDEEFQRTKLLNGPGDVETGTSTIPQKKWLHFISPIFVQALTLTFLAEWGDRSQLTTIVLAAREDPYGVAVGGTVGHCLCTGLAVIGGRMIAQKISVRTVTIIGGIVFLAFAFSALFISPDSGF